MLNGIGRAGMGALSVVGGSGSTAPVDVPRYVGTDDAFGAALDGFLGDPEGATCNVFAATDNADVTKRAMAKAIAAEASGSGGSGDITVGRLMNGSVRISRSALTGAERTNLIQAARSHFKTTARNRNANAQVITAAGTYNPHGDVCQMEDK